ncbi:MAG: alkaline phosphatase family protein [Peptococcaceae bacterium]|nr:alkaline phosphatase family protein [Peptococcaceae bacterium]
MKALADKVLVLGIDGMDPKLTQKFIDEGYMPNTKKFIERGAAEEKLHMIGGFPTVTPPMWTTLATGTNPSTHGITEYYATHPEKLDVVIYNFDSTRCKSEQMWNATAEAGKKTLVWHWPGSSWPPSSDNPNLYVVDGTQPGGINCGIA